MSENILITGVNGFIGRALSKRFLAQGYNVIGIDIHKESMDAISKYYSGSVLDKDFLKPLIEQVDYVIHLAALTAHKDIVDNRFKAMELNFLGTKNVLDAFIKSKTKKFVYASTGKVYGRIYSLPLTEESPKEPLNPLGKSKYLTERLIDFYSSPEKSLLILRLFNVYGKNLNKNFLIPNLIEQVKHSDVVTLGDINAKRDYIYIEDVVNAFNLCLENKTNEFEIFNVCSGIPRNAKDILEILERILKKEIKIKINPSLFRYDEYPVEYGSYEKIKSRFGWSPLNSLESFLQDMVK